MDHIWKVFWVYLAVLCVVIGLVQCVRHLPHKTKIIHQAKHGKVYKEKPNCDGHGKCEGAYVMTDGSDWYVYQYTFQGTDSSSARSIPSNGWSKTDKPREEELEQEETVEETTIDVETEVTDTSVDVSGDSGDAGGGDGGGGDGGGGD